jgi:uncharacterized protein YjbI with pentapeptide repeats
LSCSRDGGQSWNSQLIPGHRGDPDYSLNLDFAADPNLVAAPGGLFYNFIASNRDHVGGIFVQRFAWKNKEDGWPLIQVGGPILINKGTSGRFIDKPHMIGFLDDDNNEKVTMTWTDGAGSGSQAIPAGDLGMAAAVFVGNDNNDGTKILYWSSNDWGETWNNPTKLTESTGVNSGINLASNGDNVCATWRRFDDTNETSSILYACSTDRGKRFGRPKVIYESMCPFDQVTLNGVAPAPKDIVSFRTNAFPVIAGDGQKFYVFWSDRGFSDASDGQNGCNLRTETGDFNPSYGRIVYSVTGNNGKSWSNPKPVDDAPSGEGALIGHQFMPAAFGANGEVVVSWIDNRDDVANVLDVDKQLIVDFWKEGTALYRHTTDIRSARLVGGAPTSSVKVSNYTKALFPLGGLLTLRQMEFNLVNARLFQKGTAPFIGDYLSVTANAYNRSENGEWVNSNSSPLAGSPTFHISWGDNRDVRGNAWGDADSDGFSAPSPYTPTSPNSVNASLGDGEQIKNSTPTVEDPPDNQQQQCVPNSGTVTSDRTRDQNIYSAPLYPLATMQSPGAIKVTGQVQRALPLYVTNNSLEKRYFQLEITGQPDDFESCSAGFKDGSASFRQDPVACSDDVSRIVLVNVSAKSSAVRTVFITSANPLPNIPVELSTCIDDAGQLSCGAEIVSTVVLNNDPLDFGGNLEQPDYTIEDILTQELHNPDLLNPDLLNPDLLNLLLENPDLLNELLNLGLVNVDLLNPDLMNLLIENPDLLNPDLLNPDLMNLIVANPDLMNVIVENPDLLNPDLLNLMIANPDLMNPDLLNPDLLNPDLMNPDLLNLIVENPDLLNPDLLNLLVYNPDLMNPDLLNIELTNPDLMNPDLMNPDLLNTSLYNIVVANPDLMNPDLMNPDLLNPDLLNPDLLNLIVLNPDLLNPDLLNPDLLNPDLLNPDLLNPDLLNLLVQNPDLLNPDLLNPDLLNPDLMNPDLLNPDLINGALSYTDVENPDIERPAEDENIGGMYVDVTWQVKNDGNTTTGYMAQPYIAGPEEHTATQLIVSKPYLRQTTRNCIPVIESDNQVVVNIYNPPNQEPINNPNPEDNAVQGLASYWLAPGEIANVTLRIFGTSASQLHASRAGLYVNSEACNTGETVCSTQPSEETVRDFDIVGPLIAPLSVVMADTTVEATSPLGGVIQFETPTATDNGQSVPVTCTYESGSQLLIGDYTGENANICTAVDGVGNESQTEPFEFSVEDTTAPTFTAVPDLVINAEASEPGGAVVTYLVEAVDSVDVSVTITCTKNSGELFALGDTLVTCDAEDDENNTSTISFDVVVEDHTSPFFTLVPIDVTVEATGTEGATVDFSVLASDIVDPAVALNCSADSGNIFEIGSTTVTCTATDASGNSATASFEVVIRDTTAPVITAQGAIEVEATSGAGANVDYLLPVFDTVDGPGVATCIPLSGSIFQIGQSYVSCSATDTALNQSIVSFTVTVVDTTPPDLIVPGPISLEATSPQGSIVAYANNGEMNAKVSATDIVSSPDQIAIVCEPPSESLFAITVTTVTCIATDGAGNSSDDQFEVSVVDTTAPEISVPNDITVPTETESGSVVDFEVEATDVGDANVEVTCSPVSGSIFAVGATPVECIATDDTGNSTTGTFNINVRTNIIWIEPVDDPATGNLGANMNFRWGYGAGGVLSNSSSMIDKPGGKGTKPLSMKFFGETCEIGNPQVVDLDAGKSSLRYSSGEWQLNWQTGQSTIDGGSITSGCFELSIPRAADPDDVDKKLVILN